MELKRQQSIIFVSTTLLCISSLASAQLTYHLDANTNSYTLQTPNSQQSFTRYFNGQSGAGNKATRAHPVQVTQPQQQQQQQQPQQQLFSTGPQQFAYQNDGDEINAYYRQQQELQQQQQQQQQQRQQEQNNLYTTYQVPRQEAQQAHPVQSLSQQDVSAYYQQVQQAQLQQQQEQLQQQQLATQQQTATQQRFAYQGANQNDNVQYQDDQAQQYTPQSHSLKQFEQQSQANNLLGVKFSPSNEVSHVKYTSDGLNYNF